MTDSNDEERRLASLIAGKVIASVRRHRASERELNDMPTVGPWLPAYGAVDPSWDAADVRRGVDRRRHPMGSLLLLVVGLLAACGSSSSVEDVEVSDAEPSRAGELPPMEHAGACFEDVGWTSVQLPPYAEGELEWLLRSLAVGQLRSDSGSSWFLADGERTLDPSVDVLALSRGERFSLTDGAGGPREAVMHDPGNWVRLDFLPWVTTEPTVVWGEFEVTEEVQVPGFLLERVDRELLGGAEVFLAGRPNGHRFAVSLAMSVRSEDEVVLVGHCSAEVTPWLLEFLDGVEDSESRAQAAMELLSDATVRERWDEFASQRLGERPSLPDEPVQHEPVAWEDLQPRERGLPDAPVASLEQWMREGTLQTTSALFVASTDRPLTAPQLVCPWTSLGAGYCVAPGVLAATEQMELEVWWVAGEDVQLVAQDSASYDFGSENQVVGVLPAEVLAQARANDQLVVVELLADDEAVFTGIRVEAREAAASPEDSS